MPQTHSLSLYLSLSQDVYPKELLLSPSIISKGFLPPLSLTPPPLPSVPGSGWGGEKEEKGGRGREKRGDAKLTPFTALGREEGESLEERGRVFGGKREGGRGGCK